MSRDRSVTLGSDWLKRPLVRRAVKAIGALGMAVAAGTVAYVGVREWRLSRLARDQAAANVRHERDATAEPALRPYASSGDALRLTTEPFGPRVGNPFPLLQPVEGALRLEPARGGETVIATDLLEATDADATDWLKPLLAPQCDPPIPPSPEAALKGPVLPMPVFPSSQPAEMTQGVRAARGAEPAALAEADKHPPADGAATTNRPVLEADHVPDRPVRTGPALVENQPSPVPAASPSSTSTGASTSPAKPAVGKSSLTGEMYAGEVNRALKRISEVTTSLALPPVKNSRDPRDPDEVDASERPRLPRARELFAQQPPQIHGRGGVRARPWPERVVMWEAPNLAHHGLYFEEVNLERYGYSFGLAQPVVSAAHFFGRLPALPYLVTLEPPYRCVPALGHYRPGSCAPLCWNVPPFDPLAAVVQGGVVTGLVFLIP